MRPRRIAIIGAGFSGLTLARSLLKSGFEIEIFENKSRPGGLVQTFQKPVMVEAAAHAFLASQEVEELFEELQVPVVRGGFRSRAKWIFRHRARKWPLGPWETLRSLVSIFISRIGHRHWPKPRESVAAWVHRQANSTLNDFLVSPGLQGVYGARSRELSASLIIGSRLFAGLRPRSGRLKGSVAPRDGMQSLMEELSHFLIRQGVQIHYQSPASLESLKLVNPAFDAVVIATSIKNAAELLKVSAPVLSEALLQIPRVSLSSATVALAKPTSRARGFGCLFPEREKFHSLGVLFNTDLFENRGVSESETWIFNSDFSETADEQVLQKIKEDRMRLVREEMTFSFHQVLRWPEVLPLYGPQLEALLEADHFDMARASALKTKPVVGACELRLPSPSLKVISAGARVKECSEPVYLTGNYLGAIGLTKILSYNQRLAERISADLSGGKI